MHIVKNSAALLELHIRELVLGEVAAAKHRRVSDAMERELSRLLVEQETPLASSRTAEIPTSHGVLSSVDPNESAELKGIHLAQAIYGAMNR